MSESIQRLVAAGHLLVERLQYRADLIDRALDGDRKAQREMLKEIHATEGGPWWMSAELNAFREALGLAPLTAEGRRTPTPTDAA